jgi:hypothetical protein
MAKTTPSSEQKKVLTIVDKSAKAFLASATTLTKTLAEVNGLGESVLAIAQEIEFKQSELDNINTSIVDGTRAAKVELDFQVKENEEATLNALMRKFGFAQISTKDLALLNQQLEDANADNAEAIASAVSSAEKVLHIKYSGEASTAKAEHKVVIAEVNASVTAKTQEISFLNRNVTSLEKTITDEREARVSIANADAQKQGVTVNTTAK